MIEIKQIIIEDEALLIKLDEILEKARNGQINLGSKSARNRLSKEIIQTIKINYIIFSKQFFKFTICH